MLRLFDFNAGRWVTLHASPWSQRRCTRPDCARHAAERRPIVVAP